MISAPMAAWTVTGTSCSWAASRMEASAPGRLFRLAEGPGETLSHPLLGPGRRADRGVHPGPGLLRHAEAAVRQTGLYVLARPSKRRQLEVVNSGGTVHRDVGDDPACQPGVDERTQAYLYDVAAQEENHPPAFAGSINH